MKRVTKWLIFLIGLVFVLLAGLFVWWARSFTNTIFDKTLMGFWAV